MGKFKRKNNKNTNPILERCSFEKELALDDGTLVTVRFDESVYERVWEHLPLLLFSRGIKTDLSASDPDAALLMRRRAKREEHSNITAKDLSEVQARLRDVHGRAVKIAQAQLLLCYVIDADDKLFSIEELPKGGIAVTLLPPFDKYEIPDNYWGDNSNSDPLKRLLVKSGHFMSQEPTLDPTNPLEIMLAYTAGIIDANPNFNDALTPLLERATIGLSFGEAQLGQESLDIFLKALDDLSLEPMAGGDSPQ